MTQRQFLLGTFILITILSLLGTYKYFDNQRVELEVQGKVKQVELEQEGLNHRTDDRWGWLNSIISGPPTE